MINKIYDDISGAFSNVDKKDLKVCVLGIGSDLRGDDVAGLLVVDCLSRKCMNLEPCDIKNKLHVLYGSTAPENCTGDIKRSKPTHLVVVDSADMGLKPGDIKILGEDQIGGVSFSTHMLPLSVMIQYLKNSIDFKTVIVGIQPKNIDFGAVVNTEIIKASEVVADSILKTVE